MTPPVPAASRRRQAAGLHRVWILLLLAFVVHAPSLGNDFVHDDRFLARAHATTDTANVMIATLQPFGDDFTSPYWNPTASSSCCRRWRRERW